MGWTDLFKSKSIKGKLDPRIRWFGKLPTYADYYSSKTDEEWAVEFNDWVLKGFEIYATRQRETQPHAQAHTPRLPITGCAVRLPKSGMTVLASIQDYGGDMRGRPFPLCFYVGVPTAMWPGPTADRAACALRVLDSLNSLRKDLARFFNSPGRFESVFGNREVDLEDFANEQPETAWQLDARTIAWTDWFAQAASGLKTTEPAEWLRLAGRFGDNIAKHESEDFEPTLRFPLAPKLSTRAQVGGWLRWLEGRLDLKRRWMSLFLTGIIDGDSEPARLAVVARPALPDDFLLATLLAGALPYLDDACQLADPPAAEGEAAAAAAPQLPKSWAEFVEAAATVA